MDRPKIDIPHDALKAFCQKHQIQYLRLFGSVLRDDFGSESDVDVLVKFEPGAKVGLKFFAMERELSEILGRRVDLNTEGFLGESFRDEVMATSEEIYALSE